MNDWIVILFVDGDERMTTRETFCDRILELKRSRSEKLSTGQYALTGLYYSAHVKAILC